MIPIITSAHINKSKPIPLAEFTKRRFPGNITAYRVDWQDKDYIQAFPLHSHSELNISEQSFNALKILFPYLGRIFRATGADFIPQKHSKITDHLVGLNFLCDEIFNPEAKAKIQGDLCDDFDKISKLVRLSLMLHDMPEIPGEISTFCQRLPMSKDKAEDPKITEGHRQELEHRIAELLIFYSLKAVYDGRNSLHEQIHEAIISSQDKTQLAIDSAEQRYHIVEDCINKIQTDTKTDFGKEFARDYQELLTAYYLAENSCEFQGQESYIGNLVKLIDKLESKLHCAVVGDYSIFKMDPDKIIVKEYKQTTEFIKQFARNPIIKAICENILRLYEASTTVFREWDNLDKPLSRFSNWMSLTE